MSEPQGILVKRLRYQADACRLLGSDLYAFLLERAADDVEAGGVVSDVMDDSAYEPPGAAVALRFMGGVHRIVLEGRAPRLARFYPSAGGDEPPDGSWQAFDATLRDNLDELKQRMMEPVQTNEVGRCAGLLGGFLHVAKKTGLPLRLIEIGCSGGLNLRWDRYRYEVGDGWGPNDSPVVLGGFESAPDTDVDVRITERLGCDPHPVRAETDQGRLTLSSFVWPDQAVRWKRLRAALDIAAEVPVMIRAVGAASLLEEVLRDPVPGVATVVYHSIVLQYLEQEERARTVALIREAGERATEIAPVAHLSMEPPSRHLRWAGDASEDWEGLFPEPDLPADHADLALLHLRLWPHQPESRLVGRAGYHGSPIHWYG